MIGENLKFVFQKAIGRVIEATVLRFVLKEVGTNVGVPLLKIEIERALQQDQPEAIRQLLLNALQKLDQEDSNAARAIESNGVSRIVRDLLPGSTIVTQQTI